MFCSLHWSGKQVTAIAAVIAIVNLAGPIWGGPTETAFLHSELVIPPGPAATKALLQ